MENLKRLDEINKELQYVSTLRKQSTNEEYWNVAILLRDFEKKLMIDREELETKSGYKACHFMVDQKNK